MLDLFSLAMRFTSEGDEDMKAAIEHVEHAGEKAEHAMDALGGAVAGVVAALGALESVKLAKEWVGEFAVGEQSVKSLEASVISAGGRWPKFAEGADHAAESLQRFGFQDHETNAALSILVRLTGNTSQALDAVSVAAQLATVRHMDLESASVMVARAMNGHTTALKRMGIEVDATGNVVEQLKQKLTGAAEAAADSLGGALARLRVQQNETHEDMGQAIADAVHLRDNIEGLADTIKHFREEHPQLLAFLAATGVGLAVVATGIIAVGVAIAGIAVAVAALPAGALWLLGGAALAGVMAAPMFGLIAIDAAKARAEIDEFAKTLGDMNQHELALTHARLTNLLFTLKEGSEEWTRTKAQLAAVSKQYADNIESERAAHERAAAAAKKAREEDEKRIDALAKVIAAGGLTAKIENEVGAAIARYRAEAMAANVTDEERSSLLMRATQLQEALTKAYAPATEAAKKHREEMLKLREAMHELLVETERRTEAAMKEAMLPLQTDIARQLAVAAQQSAGALLGPGFHEGLRQQILTFTTEFEHSWLYAMGKIQGTVQRGMQTALADGLVAGFQQAFSGGGIEGAVRGMTASILSSFGKMLVEVGSELLVIGGLFEWAAMAIAAFSGGSVIAAGLASIAIGTGLMALGSRIGPRSSVAAAVAPSGTVPVSPVGSPWEVGGLPTSFGSMHIPFGSSPLGQPFGGGSPMDGGDSAKSVSRNAGPNMIQLVVIGERDPVAQRAIVNLIKNAKGRNLAA